MRHPYGQTQLLRPTGAGFVVGASCVSGHAEGTRTTRRAGSARGYAVRKWNGTRQWHRGNRARCRALTLYSLQFAGGASPTGNQPYANRICGNPGELLRLRGCAGSLAGAPGKTIAPRRTGAAGLRHPGDLDSHTRLIGHVPAPGACTRK